MRRLAWLSAALTTFGTCAAHAQSAGDAAGAPSLSQAWFRLFSFVQDQQQWFSQHMTGAIEDLAGGSAWNAGLLLALFSFVYGVFHAVGPGHGKAVISSYVLANKQTLTRGVVIAFMAGIFQALSAIVLVSVLALILHLGSRQMTAISNNLESISYAVITLFGLWLLFGQIRDAVFRSAQAQDHDHDHEHDHEAGGHDHDHSDDHGHDHEHDHHGHAHLPDASELEGAKWSWAKAISIAFAVGIRPCTGALIVLVVALHQQLYWAGVISTFIMGLGTAITVSALATMAVASREAATRLAGSSELWVGRVETIARIGGGVVMSLFGVLFFFASLYPHPLAGGG